MSGNDFFDRERELFILESRIRERNHLLLTGQRRMGKTSILRELGRRLQSDGWIFLFVDVEGATCAEDVIADIAQAAYPYRPIASRFTVSIKRWFNDKVEELGAHNFRVKVRAGLDAGSWRRYGERLLGDCAASNKPVLLVIDELPIFLKRMISRDDNSARADEFLSWLRSLLHTLGDRSPVLVVSGSIGLEALVRGLGMPDRINHLDTFRLGPWDRESSVACIHRLAASHGLSVEAGVADAVYETLGVGIPHHIQSFFARLRDHAMINQRHELEVADVGEVYRLSLLGPSCQNDLVHYQTRLKDALGNESYSLAMEILAEAATMDVFTPTARRRLEALYAAIIEDAPAMVGDTLDVLIYDGYVEAVENGHRFSSRLLRDWWAARFRGHHKPLEQRHTSGRSIRPPR